MRREQEMILAIDQGTTSTRAIVFDRQGHIRCIKRREVRQYYPHCGWVEHDAEEIWEAVVATAREAMMAASQASIAAIGITNQRETTVLWDKATGHPIAPAIVWQDRRTANHCRQLEAAGYGSLFYKVTGLKLDPYFSATKIAWLLDHIPGARDHKGLAFGTMDSFLVWRLTEGRIHATDATNASRTLIFDIHQQCWSQELLDILAIPESLLPEVKDSSDDFGVVSSEILGQALPIRSVIGDQQAASLGQACLRPGMAKNTYGTGCFLMLNTGESALASRSGLLSTTAWRLKGKTCYALEGSIFAAGSVIQWLCDNMGVMSSLAESERLAASLNEETDVYMVPAFVGLGAPYWDPGARAALFGLDHTTGKAEIARAALDAICFQTRDLVEAMYADQASFPSVLRADGGMATNDWLMQRQADLLGIPVERPQVIETTALGAAYLAGLGIGWFDSLEDTASIWRRDRLFEPNMSSTCRESLYDGWKEAIQRVISKP